MEPSRSNMVEDGPENTSSRWGINLAIFTNMLHFVGRRCAAKNKTSTAVAEELRSKSRAFSFASDIFVNCAALLESELLKSSMLKV